MDSTNDRQDDSDLYIHKRIEEKASSIFQLIEKAREIKFEDCQNKEAYNNVMNMLDQFHETIKDCLEDDEMEEDDEYYYMDLETYMNVNLPMILRLVSEIQGELQ
jgi:ribosomal 30S subunit maturation factor RimM